jgi:hypothetical protein
VYNIASQIANGEEPIEADTGTDTSVFVSPSKPKPSEYEGRGTVCCHLCQRTFTMKQLLRRHYMSNHKYDPKMTTASSVAEDAAGDEFREDF